MKKQLFITILFALIMQMKSQTSNRFDEMKTHFNESEIVFEGYFKKKNPSFLTSKKEIFTLLDFKVTKLIKGRMSSDSIIKIEIEGGAVVDPETGLGLESSNSHGYGFIQTSKGLYYLYPKNERGYNKLKRMIDIANPDKIRYNDIEPNNPQPYTKLSELYADISQVTGTTYIVEKKSPNAEREVKKENNTLSYEEKSKNFNDLIASKIELASANLQNKTFLVNDLTLQITNGVINGTVYEFDINIKADNNATYLDNVPVWISYNSAVFGSSVVAAGNVTVTNGTPFNNSSYYPANSFITDNSSSVFIFAVSAVSSPVRTNITTTYKFLAHVKLNIYDCGNVNTNLTMASTAINSCLYTITANGSSLQNYNTLTYNGSLSNVISICPPVIKDFTSPINGGMNQTLTIKGSKFGTVRGNGQVKFRNADNFGFPFMNKLDNLDYISWNDTMIKVRMPSTIDTINPLFDNTPGGNIFKVVTNANDSAVSNLNLASQPFKVYYSVYNLRPLTPPLTVNQKLKANLIKSVSSTGGYVIRLDTSVGNDPAKKMCIIKAIRDWDCLTTVNLKLGTDTALQAYGAADYICNFILVDKSVMTSTNTIAETKRKTVNCNSSPNVKGITDFDIRINKYYLSKFFYDTLNNNIPAYNIDFLEVMEHEIGHGIGHEHVTDSTELMYYKTLGNLSTSIPGNQRRKLMPGTAAVIGGNDQVTTSQTVITGVNQCGLKPMIQYVCFAQGLNELTANKFNAVIYPNPLSGKNLNVNFEISDNSKPIIEVYDVLGNKLYTETLNTSSDKHYKHQLNLSDYTNGIYFLNINANGNKASFKIIKN